MDNKLSEKVTELRRKVRDVVNVCEHKEGSRLVHHRDIGTVIRGIGLDPSEEHMTQIMDMVKASQGDESLLVPYTVLETTIVPWLVQNEKALEQAGFHTLMRAFKSFDTENKGWIDANTLKTTLTTKGDMLSPDEAIKMAAACVDSKGRVWYENYVCKLQA